ncbi:MAG: Uma2 family endonuclease [Waterburya sp.]
MQLQDRTYSPEEYLQLEEQAEYKSAYHDGAIIPITGGTTNHNEISLNLVTNLRLSLKQQNYRVYMADVRLWIPRHRLYTYPDVMLIQGEPIYADQGTTTVTNPVMITEVLSPSTQNYDRTIQAHGAFKDSNRIRVTAPPKCIRGTRPYQGDKFAYYRSIPEMQEYILVSQQQYHVMQYTKTEAGKWLLSEYETETAAIQLESVDLVWNLAEIYTGVDFSNTK